METNINSSPLVSVLMTVYNGEKYLHSSITSILADSYPNFELLIVDDGSTDKSAAIARQFHDPRIRIISNEVNLGLYKSRNIGISHSRGKYVATLDCDDINASGRLRNQVDFLESHPEYVVVGGKATLINEDGSRRGEMYIPIGNAEFMKSVFIFSNPLVNSSTMISASILKQLGYRRMYEASEDYDLFERSTKFGRVANLNLRCVYYRIHDSNHSRIFSNKRITGEISIIIRQLNEHLRLTPNTKELSLHHAIMSSTLFSMPYSSNEVIMWIKKILTSNNTNEYVDPPALKNAVFLHLLRQTSDKVSIGICFKVLHVCIACRLFSFSLLYYHIKFMSHKVLGKIVRGFNKILK